MNPMVSPPLLFPLNVTIKIELSLAEYTGVKLSMSYVMSDVKTGNIVLTAKSSHCFIDAAGRPISVKKHFPEFDAVLKEQLKKV